MRVQHGVSYSRSGTQVAATPRPIRRDGSESNAQPQAASQSAVRLTPLRELQLVEIIRGGGSDAQDALGELIRAYQRRIYSICLRMVRNPDDASDLTQDSLIKIIEGLAGYGGQSKLSTWVIRVTMNCCLSHLRKQKLRSHESLDAAPAGMSGLVGEPMAAGPAGGVRGAAGGRGLSGSIGPSSMREPLPAQRIEQEQARSAVAEALDSLDADMRSILVLRDLQDMDYQQLAEALDIPIGTVKSRLFRARAALREAIENRGGI